MVSTEYSPQTSPEPARTVAVIDIGSNSLRMVIADVAPDGRTEVLERARRPVHLGHDTFVAGKLSHDTMHAALNILRDYRRILDTYGVKTVRAVATSAVREASNRDAFVDRLSRAVGLDVEVIDPSEQSRLMVSAVREEVKDAIDLGRQTAMIAEVGGGSTLVSLLDGGRIADSRSYNLGSVRMQELLSTTQEPPQRAAELLRRHIGNAVSLAARGLSLDRAQTFIAVGGDARFAAEQVGQSSPEDTLSRVEREDLAQVIRRCAPAEVEQLSRRYGIAYADAETLVPALLVYQSLLEATGADAMLVSNVSMRDGLLLDLPHFLSGEDDPVVRENVIASARNLAERYQSDMAHADQVACLSLRLFDELQKDHGLSQRHRLLLHVAALLHDTGSFVSGRAHHKHSFYLISNSELFGLQGRDAEIVAHTARYHRRSMPKSSHAEYMALPRETRMVVNKLAALLRLADALDRGHSGQVDDFKVERRDTEFVIYARNAGDLALERRAIAAKSDLFEEVFGMHVRLESEQISQVR